MGDFLDVRRLDVHAQRIGEAVLQVRERAVHRQRLLRGRENPRLAVAGVAEIFGEALEIRDEVIAAAGDEVPNFIDDEQDAAALRATLDEIEFRVAGADLDAIALAVRDPLSLLRCT